MLFKKERIKKEKQVANQDKKPEIYNINNDICVVCGRVIPEGSMICSICEGKYEEIDNRDQKLWHQIIENQKTDMK